MDGTTSDVQLGVPGRARAVAKLGLEEVIWGRVAVNNLRHRRPELPSRSFRQIFWPQRRNGKRPPQSVAVLA